MAVTTLGRVCHGHGDPLYTSGSVGRKHWPNPLGWQEPHSHGPTHRTSFTVQPNLIMNYRKFIIKCKAEAQEITASVLRQRLERRLSCVIHLLQFCAVSDKVRPVKLWPVVCAAAFIKFAVNTCRYICWILILLKNLSNAIEWWWSNLRGEEFVQH